MRWQITLAMIGKYKKEISMSHRHEKARNGGSVLFHSNIDLCEINMLK